MFLEGRRGSRLVGMDNQGFSIVRRWLDEDDWVADDEALSLEYE